MANNVVSQSQTPKEILADLYDSGLLADVTIQLKGHTIRAHRAILAKISSWFANKFTDYPEYDSKLVINLPDDNAITVKAMVRFCYTGTYSRYLRKPIVKTTYNSAAACGNNLTIHIDVHGTAEKYNATSLRAYSIQAINNEAQELLRVGPSDTLPIIKKAYSLRLQSNSLRSAAIKLLNQYLNSFKNNSFPMAQIPRVKNAPDEATELLIQIAKDVETLMVEPKHKWECSICKTTFEYTGEAKDGDLKGKMCP